MATLHKSDFVTQNVANHIVTDSLQRYIWSGYNPTYTTHRLGHRRYVPKRTLLLFEYCFNRTSIGCYALVFIIKGLQEFVMGITSTYKNYRERYTLTLRYT
jgi:hypothetical protein